MLADPPIQGPSCHHHRFCQTYSPENARIGLTETRWGSTDVCWRCGAADRRPLQPPRQVWAVGDQAVDAEADEALHRGGVVDRPWQD